MPTWYALCHGAGIRICDSCVRHVDHNRVAAAAPHQPFVAPSNSGERCANWKAKPHAVTPTDRR